LNRIKNILFINSVERNCGVHSYGTRVFNILRKATSNYRYHYCECASMGDYDQWVSTLQPVAIIYNYHPLPMQWFTGCNNTAVRHYMIWHEGSEHTNLKPDYWLYPDTTINDENNKFALPRPLLEYVGLLYPENTIPVISSFGFGFGNKGFGRVVKTVNDQFDKAIIRLHIPFAHYGDQDQSSIKNIYPGCYAEVKKPGIQLQITNEFLNDNLLLRFLAESTLNIFLYDDMPGRGLSSVLDYALSVRRPLAINNTWMFRHIRDTQPSICVEDRPLKDIITSGSEALEQYRLKWSNQKLIDKFEEILNKTL